MVAYALPSCSAKKGRGDGDSLQQFTFWASALQHHWSSWSEHWVIDSPPFMVIPYVHMFEAQPSDFQSLSVQLYLPYRLPAGKWQRPLSKHSQVSGQQAEPSSDEHGFSVFGALSPPG